MTLSRIRKLVLFFLVYGYVFITARIGFLLDEIFFCGYRRQEIREPVFILSNFRSGSTFLQRLLSKDTATFTSMQAWEVYFAPSVSQRKFYRGLVVVDAWIGAPLGRFVRRLEARAVGEVSIHKTGLFRPEEDEGVLLLTWDCLFTRFMYPVTEGVPEFHRFDTEISPRIRRRSMRYYRDCIRRHLFAHAGTGRNGSVRYLAKNPSLCPKVVSLYEHFPDAKVLYLIRTPEQVVPSVVGWFSFAWNFFCDPLEKYPHKAFIIDLVRSWFLYPLDVLTRKNPKSWNAIMFDELTTRTEQVVAEIYEFLNISMRGDFLDVLIADATASRSYKGMRAWPVREMGLSKCMIETEFADVRRLIDSLRSPSYEYTFSRAVLPKIPIREVSV